MMSRRQGTINELITSHRVEQAGQLASTIIAACGITQPLVDPIKIASIDAGRLTISGDDFGDSFDGQLEYHKPQRHFLLFYNNKYDTQMPDGEHHPRTRFSIAHELGHFYIEEHRMFLMNGGQGHGSKSEFVTDFAIEREADFFAANLLMPETLIRPDVNKCQLNLTRLKWLSQRYQTSLLSTAIRCVQLTPFPCSLVAIRDGEVVWRFVSQGFIDGGCYPLPKAQLRPTEAIEQWKQNERGNAITASEYVSAAQWFQTYERFADSGLWVRQEYLPVVVTGFLLVLVTADERDLIPEEE